MYDDYIVVIGEGIDCLLECIGIIVGEIGQVLYVMMLGLNMLLEWLGVRIGFIIIKGFCDVLEIWDLWMLCLYDQIWEKFKVLVCCCYCCVVEGCIFVDGLEMILLDESVVCDVVWMLCVEGIILVVVCLINVYVNFVYEICVVQILCEIWFEVYLLLFYELLFEEGEYFCILIMVINVYVQLVIKEYVVCLLVMMQGCKIVVLLFFMQLNGGLIFVCVVVEQLIYIIESGLVVGVVGVLIIGMQIGLFIVIMLDIGGIIVKVVLVENGMFGKVIEFQVGGYVLQVECLLLGGGFILCVFVIDLVEVGVGGGLIIVLDVVGVLQVGLCLVGLNFGLVCYGCGGMELIVIDCNLMLGYLNENLIVGGEMVLLCDVVVKVVKQQLVDFIGLLVEKVVYGVFILFCVMMIQVICVVMIECGQDFCDFVVFVFGGNGLLFVVGIVQMLGCFKVIVLLVLGVFLVFGLFCVEVEIYKFCSFCVMVSLQIVVEVQIMLVDMVELVKVEVVQLGGCVSVIVWMCYVGQFLDLQVVLGVFDMLNVDVVCVVFVVEYDWVFKFIVFEGELVCFIVIEVVYVILVGQFDLFCCCLLIEGYVMIQWVWFGDYGWLDVLVILCMVLWQVEGFCIVIDFDVMILVLFGVSVVLILFGGIEIILL